jgi:TatD DNase family protein
MQQPGYFDSHCHLQDQRIAACTGDILRRAASCGVAAMACCGSEEGDWGAVRKIGATHGGVKPSFGLHPWYVANRSADWLDRLTELLGNEPGAGVGEIGLDGTVEVDFEEQVRVFSEQLILARRLNRTVSIHCRKAWEPMLAVLRKTPLPDRGGLIHAWSGAPEMVGQIEKLGLHISFAGSITRDRNKRGRQSAMIVTAQRILIETDSPDILPSGAHGPLNEPSNLPLVAAALAQIRKSSQEEIAERTFINALSLFG